MLPHVSSLVHGNSTAVLVTFSTMTFTVWMFPNVSSSNSACLRGLAPKYLAELCVPVPDVAGRRQLRSSSRGVSNFPRYNMSNYGRRAFCFAGPGFLRLELSSWAYPAININSCLQALTKHISTPADIAPSALDTIIFCCSMGCISALTYYLLLHNRGSTCRAVHFRGLRASLCANCCYNNRILRLLPFHSSILGLQPCERSNE